MITDPGSPLEQLAKTRNARVFAGEPTIGGRYSALSPFGLVPAALMGVELGRLLDRAEEMLNACRVADGNPGLALGLALGAAWQEGRDKVIIRPNPHGFGLWVEQLLAESTGKEGRGLVPAPDESPDGSDRQPREVELADPYDLGSEFFRWEFATAVAGAILEINPFDQPNVQEAKDRTGQILSAPGRGSVTGTEPEGTVEELLAQARPGDYVAIQAFVDPAEEERLRPFVERVRAATDCVVTFGLGPRYLHSTGQLHKGGAPIGCFLQVVDDTGDELADPGAEVRLRPAHPRAGCGRLRGVEGARPSGRAHTTGGHRMNLGMVGLGRMGANMVERLREHGHTVETYARTNPERTAELAGRAGHEAPAAARRLADDPGGRPHRERLPDDARPARGRRRHRRRRQLELPRLAAPRSRGGEEARLLPRRRRLRRDLGPEGGLLRDGRRRRRRVRPGRAVPEGPDRGGRLRARRAVRRRPLREDGPQRDRVRDDAVARGGLRDHAGLGVPARPRPASPRSGSTAPSCAAGCSTCSCSR